MSVRAVPIAAAALLALGGASAAAPAPAGTIAIAAVGDMAMAPSADGGASFFTGVRRHLKGDVVLGNLEGTLATGGASKCGSESTDCFAFRAPPSYARVLRRAGFTILNLANNHAMDFGEIGQAQTLAALDRARLRHTGRPGEIAYLRAKGVRIAVIGFAAYPWAQSLLDIPGARRIVREADEKADLVIVTMHAGSEGSDRTHMRPGPEWYLGENRGNAIAFSRAVVEAGADLVVGHGPHVLRGMEWYRGRLIAYSLGNFLGNGTLSIRGVLGVSGILHATLRSDGSWVRGGLVPVRIVSPGVPAADRAKEAHALVRRLSRQDFGRRGMRVTAAGKLLPPAWRTG